MERVCPDARALTVKGNIFVSEAKLLSTGRGIISDAKPLFWEELCKKRELPQGSYFVEKQKRHQTKEFSGEQELHGRQVCVYTQRRTKWMDRFIFSFYFSRGKGREEFVMN